MTTALEHFVNDYVTGEEPTWYPSRSSEPPRILLRRAARERNVHVKRVHQNSHALVRGSQVIGGFDVSLTTLTSAVALECSNNWDLTCSYLNAAGIPRPPSGAPADLPPGIDVRAYVVHEQVISALALIPFFVIGDGTSTITDLARAAAEARQANPLLGRFSLELENLLKRVEQPAYVLTAGSICFLSEETDIRCGGLTIDVTTQLNSAILDLAVKACWAVPGSRAAGIDMRLESLNDAASAVITGFDASAGFTPHHYPWMGRGRPVARALIEAITRR